MILKSFNIDPDNLLAPGRGRLLIASPYLEDPYFNRSVILLCEHNEDGAFGFVLNRYIDLDLPDLLEKLPHSNSRVSLGGPVENNSLYYVHSLGDAIPGSQHIAGELYLGGDFDIIVEGLKSGSIEQSRVRFFVGYSGWGEQQLESEMEQRSWYVRELAELPLMDTERDDLWSIALQGMGEPFSTLANFPADPKLN